MARARDQFSGVSELAKAARHRLDDARALLAAGRWRGAMYTAGYVVECQLKTKLMVMFGCRKLEELEAELTRRGVLAVRATVYTHQLAGLLRLTNAADRLRRNKDYWPLFTTVNLWLPAWRYTADPSNADDAADFLEAVEKIAHWIDVNV